jgi:hypothetical protein
MTSHVQNLSEHQSHLQRYEPAKKHGIRISTMKDIIVKDLLILGSAMVVVVTFLYLIF